LTRNDFFTDAGLALDEDGHFRRADLSEQRLDGFHPHGDVFSAFDGERWWLHHRRLRVAVERSAT
jgi:hypothetical protein